MSQIVPHQKQIEDLNLFAKFLLLHPDIDKQVVDGVCYYSMVDLVGAIGDEKRKSDPRKFWGNFKRSKHMNQLALNLRQLKSLRKDGKNRASDYGDYTTAYYVAHSLPDEMSQKLRLWEAHVQGKYGQLFFERILQLQAKGDTSSQSQIRAMFETGYLALPESETADEEIGYRR